jgi:CelD/BcsL family acetyltransferase involved in cellulose biosynthesis
VSVGARMVRLMDRSQGDAVRGRSSQVVDGSGEPRTTSRHASLVDDDLRVEVITDGHDLDAVRHHWDDLAVRTRAPYMAPAWCLAWWRNVAPAGAKLRVITVRAGDDVIAVAPFYCTSTRGIVRYRMLGTETFPRAQPVAHPGTERMAAIGIVAGLRDARPVPDLLEFHGIERDSPWPRLLASHWSPRVKVVLTQSMPAFAATLPSELDAWLAGKSRNFRKQARRHRRRLEERQVVFRLAGVEESAERLADFERLHQARFQFRGGSAVLDERVMRMLRESAPELMESDRFRLHLLEHDGQVVSAEVVLAAGGEATSWLGGFDEAWAREQVSMQGLLAAVDHAVRHEDTRLDFGPGAQSYKQRFCDREEQLDWITLYPPGPRRPFVMAATLPGHVGDRMWQRAIAAIPEERKHQIKRLLRRFRR